MLLTVMSGLLMLFYFEFKKLPLLYETFAEASMAGVMMHSSFIAFAISILIGTAFVSEKIIAEHALQQARVDSR